LEENKVFFGNRKLTLDRYIKKGLVNDIPGSYFEKPGTLNVRSDELARGIVNIEKVGLEQENARQGFRTNAPLAVLFNYYKSETEFDLEPLLSISNQNGEIILTTAPFIMNKGNNNKKQGTYSARVVFPKQIFNSQFYFLSIFFVRDVSELLCSIQKEPSKTEELFNQVELISSFYQLLCFKMNYSSQEFDADLSKIDIKGSLLLGLNWEIEHFRK